MLRLTGALCVLSITLASAALAADPGAQPSPSVLQAATKACNDALDHGNFGSYNTIEECADDTAHKMQRAQSKRQSVASAKSTGQPN